MVVGSSREHRRGEDEVRGEVNRRRVPSKATGSQAISQSVWTAQQPVLRPWFLGFYPFCMALLVAELLDGIGGA